MFSCRDDPENYLGNLTRDNTQLLVNEIWKLPTERVDESIIVKLPKPTMLMPRLRKIPGPRPLTKWERFRREKGIPKKKRTSKKVYDTVLDVSRNGLQTPLVRLRNVHTLWIQVE